MHTLLIKYGWKKRITKYFSIHLSIFGKSISIVANQLGDRIRQLRETNNLLQRQVASQMDIDSPMLSKIERGDRKAKKGQIAQFAKLLNANEDELLTLWLADQVVEVVDGEHLALKAIQVAEEEVKYHSMKKR